MDLISRNALLDAMPKNDELFSLDVRRIICEAPKVDAEPVRHGRWEMIGADKRGRGGVFECTSCNGCYPYKCKYCPNCGAKMDAKEE